jgi:hypothetical protein
MMSDIVKKAKDLAYKQYLKNKAPAWYLTEIAVSKGVELSAKYKVDKNLVAASLYLAHVVFDPVRGSDTQKNHEKLSADFAKKYLDKWRISANKQDIILNSIESHHNKVRCGSLTAEVVKNAECFKFLSVEGCMIFMHTLGDRKTSMKDSFEYLLYKINQKYSYLTLDECKKEADKNISRIHKFLTYYSKTLHF